MENYPWINIKYPPCLFFVILLGNNVKLATEEGGVREVCNVLRLHMNSSEVAEAACAGLLALSLDGRLFQDFFIVRLFTYI